MGQLRPAGLRTEYLEIATRNHDTRPAFKLAP
jgi:hypothetical protein